MPVERVEASEEASEVPKLLPKFRSSYRTDALFSRGVAERYDDRELVANTLVHREYLSPIPARLTIDARGIETLNASRPAFEGRLDPGNLMPVPKNPIIASFFLQVGLCEQLGSGTRNLYEYAPLLFGSEPVLEEGQVFRAFVADDRDGLHKNGAIQVEHDGVDGVIFDLLSAKGEVTSREVAEAAGVTPRTASTYLRKLVEAGKLKAKGSTNQRRYVYAV